jgi:hypothetical protein
MVMGVDDEVRGAVEKRVTRIWFDDARTPASVDDGQRPVVVVVATAPATTTRRPKLRGRRAVNEEAVVDRQARKRRGIMVSNRGSRR